LENMVEEPKQAVKELQMMSEEEREQVVRGWNASERRYEGEASLVGMIEEQGRRRPEAIAVVYEAEAVSYGELNRRAGQMARYLRRAGVKAEEKVGIRQRRSVEMVVSVVGVLKAGGAYVPMDPEYPEERLEYMRKDGGVKVVLVDEGEEERGEGREIKIDVRKQRGEIEKEIEGEDEGGGEEGDNLAYVIYTSGSTGKPKGVAMRHGPLTNLIPWQNQDSTPRRGARTLQFTSLSFDVSFQEIFATLCSGGTLILPSDDIRRDMERLLQYISDTDVDRLFLPFVALQQLAELFAGNPSLHLKLREVITAGEQLHITPPIINLFNHLDDCRLYNQYGPTEAHVVTELILSGAPENWPPLPFIGCPIANIRVYILDDNLC